MVRQTVGAVRALGDRGGDDVIDLDPDVDVDVDFDDVVARGLRGYVWLVADALGLRGESWYVKAECPANVYLAVDGRLPGFPDRDVALLWDEEYGWSAAVETHSGEDLIVLSYLGSEVLPPPRAVAEWVTDLLRGEHRGDPRPARLRTADAEDGLSGPLAAYASALSASVTSTA